jgi:peroxiredoxin
MNKSIFPVLICLLGACLGGCQPKDAWLSGTAEGVQNGKVYLLRFDDKSYRMLDSARITDGRFSFSAKGIVLPEFYALTLDTAQSALTLFLDKSPVSVQLDSTNDYAKSLVKGSVLQDEYEAYLQNPPQDIRPYIKAHPKSLVAAYVFYRFYTYQLTPDEIRADLRLFDSSLANTHYLRIAKALADRMEQLGLGHQAPDFTADTPEGQAVRLSEQIGKGYLLIDFWASWCGPCRRESPNLVRAYRKYKDKGFDILGVSLDKDKADWTAAIHHDSLDWTQVSDLRFWDSAPARLYGVRAIPSNVLVDKKGRIIARNLRGEALEEKLSALLGK